MAVRKSLTGITGIFVALALALGLSLGTFVALPAPQAAAISADTCTAGGPGFLFLHDLYNDQESPCFAGLGGMDTLIYNKNYASNRASYNATICWSGTCIFLSPNGGGALLNPNNIITRVALW